MFLDTYITDNQIKIIGKKVLNGQRISLEEGVYLYDNGDLPTLGYLANFVREKKNGNKTYFNRNLHIEPTNACVYSCKFCSYYKKKDEEGWEYSAEQMIDMVRQAGKEIKEVQGS